MPSIPEGDHINYCNYHFVENNSLHFERKI